MQILSRTTQSCIARIILVAYIGFGLLGFMHALAMADMQMNESDCPLTHLIESVGSTVVASHINIVDTPLVTVLSFVGLVLFLQLVQIYSLYRQQALLQLHEIRTILITRKRRRYLMPHLMLYSDGVLNTKVF
jgi:hypothetical protein